MDLQKEERQMEKQIAWEENLDAAKARAAKEGKPVFLDFFNPG
jgi:hypothetical protein